MTADDGADARPALLCVENCVQKREEPHFRQEGNVRFHTQQQKHTPCLSRWKATSSRFRMCLIYSPEQKGASIGDKLEPPGAPRCGILSLNTVPGWTWHHPAHHIPLLKDSFGTIWLQVLLPSVHRCRSDWYPVLWGFWLCLLSKTWSSIRRPWFFF